MEKKESTEIGEVIKGWRDGILGFNGKERRFIVAFLVKTNWGERILYWHSPDNKLHRVRYDDIQIKGGEEFGRSNLSIKRTPRKVGKRGKKEKSGKIGG